MWPVSWGHQCCESPAAFACVVVMCVVWWEGSDEARPFEFKRTQSQKDGSSTSWIEPSLCINQPVLTFV